MAGKERAAITVVESPELMRARVKEYFLETVTPLLSLNGLISIGVSGGSMPNVICDVMKSIEHLDWHRIRIFMVDERIVPIDDKDRNFRAYKEKLPENMQNCLIPMQLHETSISRIAAHYELTLKQNAMPEFIGRLPRFDVLFLGMGPDGHTCSLFPGHRLLKSDFHPWILSLDDSPKPPPKRVTISLHCINAAKNVAFIITGEDKSSVVKAVLDGDRSYPAALVRPQTDRLRFFLDSGAASKL